MADNYNPNNGAPNNYGYQNNTRYCGYCILVVWLFCICFSSFGDYWYYFSGNVKGSRILRRYQNSGFCAFVDLCYSRSYYFLCLRYRLCWYRLRRGVQLNIVQYIFKPPVLKDNTYKSGVFLLSYRKINLF